MVHRVFLVAILLSLCSCSGGGSSSSSSGDTTSADATPPSFGGLVVTITINTNTIRLIWLGAQDPSTPITYLIYQAVTTGGQNFSQPSYTTQNTSYDVTGLTSNTTFYFVVRAKDSAGNTDANTKEKSAVTNAGAIDSTPPTFGGVSTATANSTTSVTLSWTPATDPSTPITYLIYQASTSGGENYSSPSFTTQNASFQVTGLTPNTTYYFVVRAKDAADNTDANAVERPVSTEITPPTFNGLVSAVAIDTNTITLTWSAATDPSLPITYLIYQATTSGTENYSLPTYTTQTTTFNVTGLNPSTNYYFVVRAQDNSGNIDSNIVEKSATTKGGKLWVSNCNFFYAVYAWNNATTVDGLKKPEINISNTSPSGIYLDIVNDRLYTSGEGNNAIFVWDNAGTLNGATQPNRTITSNELITPVGLFVDTASNRLYVASLNSILVYNNASTINGLVTPDREIKGPSFTASGVFVDTTRDMIYATEPSSGRIEIFHNASTINGTIVPNRTISGINTMLDSPMHVFIDVVNDRLYVTNYLSIEKILVFNNASTINGDVAPDRTISGGSTGLVGPHGIFVDTVNDRLYISDELDNSVRIWNSASTVNGNIAPDRVISGAATTFGNPEGIIVDVVNDRLYVGDPLGNGIKIWNSASTVTGNTPPSRVIRGPDTTLNCPLGIFVDSKNQRLYVASNTTSISIWDNANAITGPIAPNRVITTASMAPNGLTLDVEGDRLYVTSNNNAILIWDNASTANGSVAPSRTVMGASTTLIQPSGIFLDKSNDRLYICNSGGGSILAFNSASTINGNVAPSRTITSTSLYTPVGLSLDLQNDRIYAADYNNQSVLIFNNASTINGSISPARTIQGGSTTINFPQDLFLDRANDTIYVTTNNFITPGILMFANASTVNGDVSPSREIRSAGHNLEDPKGIFVDITQ